jgi:hypothetical protein
MLTLIQNGDPLRVLAAAVTPVVMVSAAAILISGVNSRYISISDRMRSLRTNIVMRMCPLRDGPLFVTK